MFFFLFRLPFRFFYYLYLFSVSPPRFFFYLAPFSPSTRSNPAVDLCFFPFYFASFSQIHRFGKWFLESGLLVTSPSLPISLVFPYPWTPQEPCLLDLGLEVLWFFGPLGPWDLWGSFDRLIFGSLIACISTSRLSCQAFFSHCYQQWRFLSAFCIWQRDLYFFFFSFFSTIFPLWSHCTVFKILWCILHSIYCSIPPLPDFPLTPLLLLDQFSPFKTNFLQTNSDGGKKEESRGCTACCQDS